ncbi:hypothetical protein [Citrobacter freundii]|uniref:hypothetical protein n=1 Tax=Citrobacter freundii TaxID=546 RepID=UPI00174E5CA9|nr:hypothetical protein [Citrobacter freundii]EAT2030497.1 hypothetical protein [Salmonella enterica]MBD5662450.1 hypothetical protein [Citrobacter freundii]
MRLLELKNYLDEILNAGIDPDTLICLADTASEPLELFEITDVTAVTGPYREDPAPKMPAFLRRNGDILLFTSSALLSTHELEATENNNLYKIRDINIDTPEKSWPKGWGK